MVLRGRGWVLVPWVVGFGVWLFEDRFSEVDDIGIQNERKEVEVVRDDKLLL
jgi:hypothetical protein